MSKDLRKGEKLQLTRVRQQVKETSKGQDSGLPKDICESNLPKEIHLAELDSQLMCDTIEVGELPQVQEVFITTEKLEGLPVGSVIAQDPNTRYLRSALLSDTG
jgi:hypothetical protein